MSHFGLIGSQLPLSVSPSPPLTSIPLLLQHINHSLHSLAVPACMRAQLTHVPLQLLALCACD